MKFKSIEDAILVKNTEKNKTAIAACDFKAGEVIARFTSMIFTAPHMHTICVGENLHIRPSMNAEYLSHACAEAANCRILPSDLYIAVQLTKSVNASEELSFDYNTTEWEMHSPFECVCAKCKISNDKTMVRGFKYLSPMQRLEIINEVTPYIAQRAAAENKCKLMPKPRL